MENEIKQLREEFGEYVAYATALIQECQSDYDKAEKLEKENEEIRKKSKEFVASIMDIRS